MPDRQEDRQHTGIRATPAINSISAVTLATHDKARAVRFYRALALSLRYGREDLPVRSFSVGFSYLNPLGPHAPRHLPCCGRVPCCVPVASAYV